MRYILKKKKTFALGNPFGVISRFPLIWHFYNKIGLCLSNVKGQLRHLAFTQKNDKSVMGKWNKIEFLLYISFENDVYPRVIKKWRYMVVIGQLDLIESLGQVHFFALVLSQSFFWFENLFSKCWLNWPRPPPRCSCVVYVFECILGRRRIPNKWLKCWHDVLN